MRTKASIFRFPLHPVFIAIAIGALVTSLVLDALYARSLDNAWYRGSFIATAVGAAALFAAMIPGFIDYFANVPRQGEVWKHANVHAIFGVALVGYFILSAGARWYTLPGPDQAAAYGALMLNVLGNVALFTQGFIGRGLVLRHFLGVERDFIAEYPPEDEGPPGHGVPERARQRRDRSI